MPTLLARVLCWTGLRSVVACRSPANLHQATIRAAALAIVNEPPVYDLALGSQTCLPCG